MSKQNDDETYKFLVNLLETRFGGLDFWKLSKKWKHMHYVQVAREIMTIIEIEKEANNAVSR